MKAGSELRQWLNDGQAQQRSLDSIADFNARWKAGPWATELTEAVEALEHRSARALLALAECFMARTAEIEQLMADLFAASRADPFFQPPFPPVRRGIHNGMLLFSHPDLSIILSATNLDGLAAHKVAGCGAGSIPFSGMPTAFRFIKAGGATIAFWEAPDIAAQEASPAAARCRLVARRQVEDGETILLDGRTQTFIIEHADGPILQLQAMVHDDGSPLSVEYDGRSHAFVGATSASEAASRVQMMVSLLRAMDRTDAAPLIAEFLRSEQHFTRWHVMRELLALDAEVALPGLQAMAAGDPHPEVRAAAQQTLDMFFGDEAEAQPEEGAVPCRA